MSSGLFDINQSPARPTEAATELFYSNLRIQETLTTIRYGIEARKGLTVITGAPGIGKSTLLQKVAGDLAANITCVFASDPRVSFSDILRLVLGHLDSVQGQEDEAAMVRNCRLQLRARLAQGQIVALFLDNAHQFPIHTVRSIIQTFLAGSAEDPNGTLLQVVLAGRNELRTRISQATLAGRRRPILCELQPLNSSEVAAFVEKALGGSNRAAKPFDDSAIKRIALYANGNPGAIKSLSERALLLAGGSLEGKIPAELVENAASELDLRRFEPSPDPDILSAPSDVIEIPKPAKNFDNNDKAIPYTKFSDEETIHAAFFPQHAPQWDGVYGRSRKPITAWVTGLTLLAIVAAVWMIRPDAALKVVRSGIAMVNGSAAPYLPSAAQPKPSEEISIGTANKTERLAPLPGPDHPAKTEEMPVLGGSKSNPPKNSPSEDLFATRKTGPKPKASTPANQEGAPATKFNSNQRHDDLQSQISRAIENRAIMGIEVSVVQGTAYLDGHVASERQRRAAERAARSVVGVERVRNRIAITFG